MPAWVPQSSFGLIILLLLCSSIQSTTGGYDGSMLNGLNALPSYSDYFKLTSRTIGINTGTVFIGGALGPIAAAPITDRYGRRMAMFWGSIGTLVGILLQTAAQDIAMFSVARIVIGFASSISGIGGGIYIAEISPSRWRAWMLGTLNNFYYVGALIAAGITLGTSTWNSTWAWRAPSLFQAIFSVLCIIIIPFVPESPRWLIRQGHTDLAHVALAQANSSGDLSNAVVVAELKEIVETLEFERRAGKGLSIKEIWRDKPTLRRFLIGISPGPFSCIAGNIIASYYLSQELDSAGITNTNSQLKANVVLNVWCLFCAVGGTQLAAGYGRKPTALVSQGLLTICLFIIGGLTKKINETTNPSNALKYGDVAVIFMFQGFYSIGWTPLLTLYVPEVLNYPIRANGNAFSSFALNAFATLLSEVLPIGIANIGWKIYIINAAWDVITFVLIWLFWVETKGLTLEEVDALFDTTHVTAAFVEDVRVGKAQIDVNIYKEEIKAAEAELEAPRPQTEEI